MDRQIKSVRLLLKRLIIAAAFLLCGGLLIAQSTTYIDLGKIKGYDTVLKRLTYYTDSGNTITVNDVTKKTFQYPGVIFPFNPQQLEGRHFVKLSVTNSGTQDSFLLYLGRAQQYSMYEFNESQSLLTKLNSSFHYYSDAIFNVVPYTLFTVPPGASKTFFIQPDIDFYTWHLFDPVVLIPDEQDAFVFNHFLKPNRLYISVTLVLLGVMLSMFSYYFAIYLRTFIREYLYYTLAMFSFFTYFSLRLLDSFMFSRDYFFFYDSKFQILQLSGSIFVLLFIASFLQLKTVSPVLLKYFRVIIYIQIIFLLINIPLTYTNRYHYDGIIGFNLMRAFLFLYCFFLIYSLLKKIKSKENLRIVIGSIISILMFFPALYIDQWSQFDSNVIGHRELALLIFMAGIVLQMMIYMQAVAYRSRTRKVLGLQTVEKLQLENDRKELEKFKAVIGAKEHERNRISQEIHDDIGSGLTSIRLLSEIAKTKNPGVTSKELEKISETSNILIDKMNEIIWSLNSRNDSLPDLIAYLRHLIVEYFDPMPIQLSIAIPDQIPESEVDGKTRRNIVLCVKEVLHNIMKHSQATEVQIQFETNPCFSISIYDNGVGFDPSVIETFKNGLHNLHHRIGLHGGTCDIINHNGTSILLKLPALH